MDGPSKYAQNSWWSINTGHENIICTLKTCTSLAHCGIWGWGDKGEDSKHMTVILVLVNDWLKHDCWCVFLEVIQRTSNRKRIHHPWCNESAIHCQFMLYFNQTTCPLLELGPIYRCREWGISIAAVSATNEKWVWRLKWPFNTRPLTLRPKSAWRIKRAENSRPHSLRC